MKKESKINIGPVIIIILTAAIIFSIVNSLTYSDRMKSYFYNNRDTFEDIGKYMLEYEKTPISVTGNNDDWVNDYFELSPEIQKEIDALINSGKFSKVYKYTDSWSKYIDIGFVFNNFIVSADEPYKIVYTTDEKQNFEDRTAGDIDAEITYKAIALDENWYLVVRDR